MPGFESLISRRTTGTVSGHPPIEQTSSATSVAEGISAATNESVASSQTPDHGCPVKLERDGGSSPSSSWSYFRPSMWYMFWSGSGQLVEDTADSSNGSDCNHQDDRPSSRRRQQQYDVYSRPLPMDPANNMPRADIAATARNALPSPGQEVSLPTERIASTIPKEAGGGMLWTYPSPQVCVLVCVFVCVFVCVCFRVCR